jgi:hypothetical protein
MGKTKFQNAWLSDPAFSQWIRENKESQFKADCILCKSSINISNNSRYSLIQHQKSKKHQSLDHGIQMKLPFSKVSSESTSVDTNQSLAVVGEKESTDTSIVPCTTVKKNPILAFRLKNDVIKAEIIWAIARIMCHTSARSSESQTELFPLMFPDSNIANEFAMKKDKVSYVITYGLAPYFRGLLIQKLNNLDNVPYYSVAIDESLNKISQCAQMDVIIRFYDETLETRYLTSIFPPKCDAETLLKTFTTALETLNLSLHNIIQLSTDGPNVNIKLHRIFCQYLQEGDIQSVLLDVGTCLLHIVHGSLKTGHKKVNWNVNEYLRRIYFLFKDFPTQRSDYIFHTGFSLFPLKFCAIRWLENVPVLKRGLKTLKPMREYVKKVADNPPDSNNFVFVKTCLKDELLEAKLEFMLSIAEECQPFLTIFQSNDPVYPFLYIELRKLLNVIYREKIFK